MARHTSYTVVAGRSAIFPMDMLRYDMAWPERSLDAFKIEAFTGSNDTYRKHFLDLEGKIRIDLISAAPSGPNVERWKSFGWRIAGKPY